MGKVRTIARIEPRIDELWELLEATRRKSGRDLHRQTKLLRAHLRKRSPREICELHVASRQILLGGFTSELWGAAYTINQGCSDDSFADFRCWLMAHGRDVWLRGVLDPDRELVDLLTFEEAQRHFSLSGGDDLYMVFINAYSRVTGQDELPERYGRKFCPIPRMAFAWAQTPSSLRKHFPNLFKKFYAPGL